MQASPGGSPTDWTHAHRPSPPYGLTFILLGLIVASLVLSFLTLALGAGATEFSPGTLLLSIVAFPVGVASIVLGVIWAYRVAAGAQAIDPAAAPSPGWAAGSWFIPVAHIVLPVIPMVQAWRASRAGGLAVPVAWGIAWAAYMTMTYVGTIWGAAAGVEYGLQSARGEDPGALPAALVAWQWATHGVTWVAAGLFAAFAVPLVRAQVTWDSQARSGGEAPADV